MKLSAQDKLQTVVQVHLLKYFPYRSEVAVFYLSISATLYFHFNIFWRQILNFFQRCVCLITSVSSDFAIIRKMLNIKPKNRVL